MIILKPERPKKKSKNWRKIKRKLPFLASLFVFAALVYLFFFSPYFVIKNVVIEGNKNIPVDELDSEVRQWMKKKYFLMFPSDNLFIFPENKFKKYLKEKFVRIELVKADKQLPETLRLSIIEKQGAFKWCRLDGCFLVNEHGIAYNVPPDKENLSEEEKTLLTIKESVNGLPSNDDKIVNESVIKSIWKINDNFGSEIAEFTIPSVFSDKIIAVTKDGWQLIFSGSFPPEDQMRNYKALFPDQISNEQKKNLEYIDLTVEGRAYYKFKN